MLRKNVNKGLGLTGLSLVAALMMSGAAWAQDGGDPAEDPVEEFVDDGGWIEIDDGQFVIDPICIECSGEIIEDGEIEDGEIVDEGSVDEGEGIAVEIYPGEWSCEDGAECPVLADGSGEDPALNPEVYYMSGNGSPEAENFGGEYVRSSRGNNVTMRGPDLCVTPAPEVVWLCELVNGKSE